MKVYINSFLSAAPTLYTFKSLLFHSAGKFLPIITAFDEPARLQWACGQLVLHILPVGDTEPGPTRGQDKQWATVVGKLHALPRPLPAAKKPDGD